MSRPYTPTEKGVPLPILHSTDQYRGSYDEKHHGWHPRSDYRGKPNTGNYALRSSRHQQVRIGEHDSYHELLRGPIAPQTREEVFGSVVMCASGYIPTIGLMFQRGEYRIEKISREYRRTMWERSEVGLSFSGVKSYILHELQQFHGQADTDELVVEEFLETKDQDTKLLLAKTILKNATRLAVEPIRTEYEKAWKTGNLPRAIRRGDKKLMSVPSTADNAVFRHAFYTQYQYGDTYDGVIRRVEQAVSDAA